MFYYKVECGNGYCGCDDEWVTCYEEEPVEDALYREAYESYIYVDGFAGSENEYDTDEEEEEWWDWYEQSNWENLSIEQITEEEYNRLINEENWGRR